MTTQLGVFAKYWQSDTVKTRLARSIGREQASKLYRCFIETTLERFRDVGDRRYLVFWPPQNRREFAELAGSDWELVEQCDGDLGQRMQSYFRQRLGTTSTRRVLIGTDSPTLPTDYVIEAFESLQETNQVVLGPSHDGGYYLVGIREAVPEIFSGIAWSTAEVFAQTVAMLERSRIPYAVLPSWYDIDEFENLRRLADDLSAVPSDDSALGRLSTMVGALLAG
jgi:rSAM/selenodomain-associated transferase 1